MNAVFKFNYVHESNSTPSCKAPSNFSNTVVFRMKGRIMDPEKLVMGKGAKFTVNAKVG